MNTPIASGKPTGIAYTPAQNVLNRRILRNYFINGRQNKMFSEARRSEIKNRTLVTESQRLEKAFRFTDILMVYTEAK